MKDHQSSRLMSIVVTSYNYEKYIGETLESLAQQSIPNLEIIVVDDGSQDQSVAIIKDYCRQYPNIHLYQHQGGENRGLPASTKLGIQKASGQYIAFCESDDYWDKYHAENLIGFIQQNPNAQLIFNRIALINHATDKKRYENAINHTHQFLTAHNGQNIFLAMLHNPIPTFSAACIQKDLLLNCDFNAFHPQYIDFWLWRQLCLTHPIYYTEKAVTYWRKHNESYDYKANIADITQFLIENNQLLKKQHPLSIADRINLAIYKRFHKSRWKIIQHEMKLINRIVNHPKRFAT